MTGFKFTMSRTAFFMLLSALWFLLQSVTITSVQAQEKIITGKTAGKTPNKLLIGVWESQGTTKGGLGIIYEFREDGGLMKGMGALV